MEIVEAYDLVGSYRGAAELVGCDPKTVKHYVERRDAGLEPVRVENTPKHRDVMTSL